MLDPRSAIFGRLAVVDAAVAGFSVSVLHESTWTATPICYLEVLFVDPDYRRHGLGRLLIKDLVDRAKSPLSRGRTDLARDYARRRAGLIGSGSFLAAARSCRRATRGSSWSARSRAAARTNELDAG